HPNNYDTTARLGSVAGMDLAVVTGRGEPIVTHWPQIGTPLVADEDVIQLGDRESEVAVALDDWNPVMDVPVVGLTAQQLLGLGVDQVVRRVADRLNARGLDRVWLHVDLDVLDPSEFAGLLDPEPFGLPVAGLVAAIKALTTKLPLSGATLAAYAPNSEAGKIDDAPTLLRIVGALASNGKS
ncbi:MAG TPA: arginase family protein, partial [Pseudolysinimonas sp.]